MTLLMHEEIKINESFPLNIRTDVYKNTDLGVEAFHWHSNIEIGVVLTCAFECVFEDTCFKEEASTV